MKYYLHDTSAFDDEKISELFINFGYEGLGLFYTVLEKLAKQEKPVKTVVLKHQLKVGKKLEKCWKFMESLDILSSNNGDTFNKQLLNFSEKYQIKKEKTAKKVSEWREKQELIKNVTSYEPICNAPKVKESKVKENKVNKSKLNGFDFIEFNFSECFNLWLKYKHDRKESYKTEDSIKAAYNKLLKLSGNNPEIATEIIEQSMANNWAGLFELKQSNNFQIKKNESINEHGESYYQMLDRVELGLSVEELRDLKSKGFTIEQLKEKRKKGEKI